MAGYRIDRITSDIKLALSELLRNMKDPRVSQLLSIVKVDVSGDLSYATVYVSAIEGYEKTVSSVKALKGAAGFLRRYEEPVRGGHGPVPGRGLYPDG